MRNSYTTRWAGFLLGITVLGMTTGRSATITWTNTAGGIWNAATNWSPNQVPTTADSVYITNAGTYTVSVPVSAGAQSLSVGTHDNTNATGVRTLTISAGTFTAGSAAFDTNSILNLSGATVAPGLWNLSGGFNWTAGAVSGSGGLILAPGSLSVISGPGTKSLASAGITNLGTAFWSGAGITGSSGGALANQGSLSITGSVSLAYGGAGTAPTLFNSGTVSLASGALSVFTAYFNNSGSYNLTASSITLGTSSVSTNTGTLNLDTASFLQFSGSSLSLGGTVIAPALNSLQMAGTAAYIITTNIVSPSIWQTAGTVYQATNVMVNSYNQANGTFYGMLPIFANNYNLTNGELRGANLTVTNFNWQAGSLNAENAASNTVTIPAGGTLTIASAGAKTMSDYSAANNGRRLVNNGVANWTGAGITGYYGAQLINNNSWTVNGSFGLAWGVGSGPHLINNGNWNLASGSGFILYGCNFSNAGTVNLTNASINFANSGGGGCVGVNSGLLNLDASSFLYLSTGTFNLGGTVVSPSADHVQFLGMTVDVNTTSLSTPALYQAAGLVNQNVTVTVNTYDQANGTWRLNLPATLNNYNLTNGELRGANVTVTNFNWQAGSLNAENAGSNTVTIPASGVLTIASAGAKNLSDYSASNNGRRLVNNGTANWTGAGITGYYGAQLVNNNTWTVNGSFSLVWAAGSGPYLINNGNWNLTSGSGFILYGCNFNNAGTVNLTNASINFANSGGGGCAGVNSGLLNLDATSFLYLSTGTFNLGGTVVSPSADHLQFLGMTVDVNTTSLSTPALYQASGLVNQNVSVAVNTYDQANGTWRLNLPATLNKYNLTNGELRGANLTITNFNWQAGSLNAENAGSNTVTIPSNGILTIASAGAKNLGDYSAANNGRRLINNGTANWTGAGITGYYGAQLVNNNTWTVNGSFSLVWAAGSGPYLINNGNWNLTSGSGFTLYGCNFNNTGTVNLTNASINFANSGGGGCAGINSGLLNLDATSFLYLSTGTFNLGGTVVSPSADHVQFLGMTVDVNTTSLSTPALYQAAGLVNQNVSVAVNTYDQANGTWQMNLPATVNNYNLTNGELRGANVTVTNFNWQAGNLNAENAASNTVTIPSNGILTIASAGAKYLGDYSAANNGRRLINNGVATWSGAGINGYYGAQLVNSNTWTVNGSFGLAWGVGSGPYLINNGIWNLTSGSGFILYGCNFNNAGTFNLTNASINFANSGGGGCAGINSGLLNLDASSFLYLSTGTFNLGGTVVSPSADHVQFLGMTVDVNTTSLNTPALYQASGLVNQNVSVAVNTYDQANGTWRMNLPATVNNYNLTNGELRGANVTVTNFNWQAGTLNAENAASNTVTIPSNGILTIASAGAKYLGDYSAANNGRRLINKGVATWSGTGINGYYGAQLVNSNTWTVNGSFGLAWGVGSGPYLINNGIWNLTSGSGFTLYGCNFNNGGTFNLTNASINFANSGGGGCVGVNGGLLNLDATSFLYLSTGTFNLGGSVVSPSADHVQFLGMTVDVNTTSLSTPALYQASGLVNQNVSVAVNTYNQASGTWRLNLPASLNNYNLTNGELRGANVTVTNFNWQAGNLNAENAASNTVTIPAGGTLTIASAGTKTLGDYSSANNGRRLINNGAGTWTGAGISGYYGAQLFNPGNLNLTGDTGLVWGSAGANTTLRNGGTFTKSGGTGVALFSGTSITNAGTININSGGITIGGIFVQTAGSANLGTNFTASSNVDIEAGSFDGRGSVAGYFYNNGSSSPGAPLGWIAATAYTNTAAGTFRVQLGGTVPGTNYDQLRLTGANSLNGGIDISLVNGFVPVAGNQFTVMLHTARSGFFTVTNSPQYDFTVLYSTTNVVLRAENAKPRGTVSSTATPFVCLPFKLSATANDIDGVVTNLEFLLNGQVVGTFANPAHANPFSTSVNLSYDFPGPATVGARITDDRGGVTTTNIPVTFVTAPVDVITPCGFQPDRSFKMCMLGQTNASYLMLANTNLTTTNWIPIGPLQNTNGIYRYVDAAATNYNHRYYRAQLQ